MASPRKRSIVAGLAGLVAFAYGTSLFVSWRPLGVRIVHEVVPFVVPLVAAGVCFRAASRATSAERASALFFGLGAVAWALGDISFSVLDLLHHNPASSLTLADAGYLALIPFWGAALLLHPARSRRGLELFGGTLDALVVFVAAATLTAAYVLIPIVASAGNFAGSLVQLTYPTSDLALLTAFVSIHARSLPRFRSGEAFVGSAIFVFVAGDIAYARVALTDGYHTGHPVDLTWVVAFLSLIVAARKGLHAEARRHAEVATVPTLTVIGIIGMVSIAVAAMFSREQRALLLIGAVEIAFLLVARMTTLLIERSRLAQELGSTVDQLEQAHQARERFVATISHDLRSPLTAIHGFAELLARSEGLSPQEVQTFTGSITRNAERLTRLTEDLLCAGQFASGHAPTLETDTLDLCETVERAVKDMGFEGRIRVLGHSTPAVGDRQRIEQVLGNLIDNAIKHSPGPEDVTVRVASDPDGPVFEVLDRGTGIAPERVQAIFDPFVSDHLGASSVGLGLYVVRNLVAAMGGRISVTTELGRGSTFHVSLPEPQPGDVETAPQRAA
jgi:signal transduction histidine kinase